MIDGGVRQALEQSAAEVLETMFFLSALPRPAWDARPPAGALLVQVAFEGDPAGCLSMHLHPHAAAAIAANFLGDDPSAIGDERVEEVAAELANMICGAVLSRIESPAGFRLAPPRIQPAESAAPAGPHPTCILDTEYGALTLTIKTDGPLCQPFEKSAF
jgi:CheY-specific phosphatase CheX